MSGQRQSLERRTVVVTRAAEQARELTALLESLGARVVLLPAVTFREPHDGAAADRAIAGLGGFDWVLFTSANAVRFFAARCREKGVDPASVHNPRFAAVGSATAETAASKGFAVSYTARTFAGAALAQELAPQLDGKRVLLPRSDRADHALPEALAQAGAEVTEVIAYQTGGVGEADKGMLESVRRGDFDVITFFSPSAVENMVLELGAELFVKLAERSAVAAIGPVTSAALSRHGVRPAIESRSATATAMAEAIVEYYDRQPAHPGRFR